MSRKRMFVVTERCVFLGSTQEAATHIPGSCGHLRLAPALFLRGLTTLASPDARLARSSRIILSRCSLPKLQDQIADFAHHWLKQERTVLGCREAVLCLPEITARTGLCSSSSSSSPAMRPRNQQPWTVPTKDGRAAQGTACGDSSPTSQKRNPCEMRT